MWWFGFSFIDLFRGVCGLSKIVRGRKLEDAWVARNLSGSSTASGAMVLRQTLLRMTEFLGGAET
jgi:hypothetical protein